MPPYPKREASTSEVEENPNSKEGEDEIVIITPTKPKSLPALNVKSYASGFISVGKTISKSQSDILLLP